MRRSAYARSATAIGLAIQADQPGTYRLSERLSRSFGVWREADCGSTIVFDPLFEKGISLPSPCEPSLTICRSYSPVHNIGHFRFSYSRTYCLGRWSLNSKSVKPVRKGKGKQ